MNSQLQPRMKTETHFGGVSVIPGGRVRRAGMTPGQGWKSASLSDGFLELLGRAEGDLLAGLDVDRFAGGRVAAHAGGALAYLQDAEADDADAVALLQMLSHPADHGVQDGLSLLL